MILALFEHETISDWPGFDPCLKVLAKGHKMRRCLLLSFLLVTVSAVDEAVRKVSFGGSLPQCALDCDGLSEFDWENDREACNYFTKRGFDCLSDCAPFEFGFDGVAFTDLPRQCHWLTLGCAELVHTSSSEADGDSFCPEICEHTECIRTYEKLIGSKRKLDLHRRCAMNC